MYAVGLAAPVTNMHMTLERPQHALRSHVHLGLILPTLRPALCHMALDLFQKRRQLVASLFMRVRELRRKRNSVRTVLPFHYRTTGCK